MAYCSEDEAGSSGTVLVSSIVVGVAPYQVTGGSIVWDFGDPGQISDLLEVGDGRGEPPVQ
jgi:hypothetical protein